MERFDYEDSARRYLEKYQVPDGPTREIFMRIAEIQNGEMESLDLVVMQRALRDMRAVIEDVYRPRSPLEAQLEYDRARRDVAEILGVEPPAWVAAEDPVVLERWRRWNESDDT